MPVPPSPSDPHLPRLARGHVLGYAVGAVGTGVMTTVPGLLLLFFLTEQLAVPAAVAGLALLVPKLLDVVVDPLIGVWSDEDTARRGSRTRWLLAGAVGLPPLFAAMFAVPDLGPTWSAVAVSAVFAAAVLAFSAFQVPWIALPAEMTDDPRERTRLMAWRMVLMTVGILAAGGAAPLIAEGIGGRSGYATMAVAMAVVIGAAMATATAASRRLPRVSSPAAGVALNAQLALVRGAPDFLALLAAYVLQSVGVAVMLAGAPYVATYRLGDPTLTSLLFVALVAPAVLAMPAWAALANRAGKRTTLLAATVLFAVGAAAMVLVAAPGRTALALGVAAALGICYAAMQLLPFSMLPDAIAVADEGPARRQAGVFTGVWTAGETTGAALGPAAYGVVLAVAGFVSSDPGTRVAQPATALTGVAVGFALLPAALLLASAGLLLRYRLDERTHEALRTVAAAPPHAAAPGSTAVVAADPADLRPGRRGRR